MLYLSYNVFMIAEILGNPCPYAIGVYT